MVHVDQDGKGWGGQSTGWTGWSCACLHPLGCDCFLPCQLCAPLASTFQPSLSSQTHAPTRTHLAVQHKPVLHMLALASLLGCPCKPSGAHQPEASCKSIGHACGSGVQWGQACIRTCAGAEAAAGGSSEVPSNPSGSWKPRGRDVARMVPNSSTLS